MALTGFYRARNNYQCVSCKRMIPAGSTYFRDEPFPMARYRKGEPVRYYCTKCAPATHWESLPLYSAARNPYYPPASHVDRARTLFEDPSIQASWQGDDLAEAEQRLVVPNRIIVREFTPEILRLLAESPEELNHLSYEKFECVCEDRLEAMGYECTRVGGSANRRDGGIDIIATRLGAPFPYFIAVQVKHHGASGRPTGPAPVRDLHGVVSSLGFNAGMLITNTSFTQGAQWFAARHPFLLKLRDYDDLRKWLLAEFDHEQLYWREIPASIDVGAGIIVSLPRPTRTS
jgi:hypothetical protein